MRDVSRRGFFGAIAGLVGAVSVRPSAAAEVAPVVAENESAYVVGHAMQWVPVLRASAAIPVPLLHAMVDNWHREGRPALPLSVDFDSKVIGLVDEIRVRGDALEVRMDVPNHTATRIAAGEFSAVAPAFINMWRDKQGNLNGPRLIALGLTSTPNEEVPKSLADRAVRRAMARERRKFPDR